MTDLPQYATDRGLCLILMRRAVERIEATESGSGYAKAVRAEYDAMAGRNTAGLSPERLMALSHYARVEGNRLAAEGRGADSQRAQKAAYALEKEVRETRSRLVCAKNATGMSRQCDSMRTGFWTEHSGERPKDNTALPVCTYCRDKRGS